MKLVDRWTSRPFSGGTLPCGCNRRHKCDQHLSLLTRQERAAWFRANPQDYYQWPSGPKDTR